MQSSGTDITLDHVLTILDEHYNNVKVLDALNQELFQMQMADKETVSDWGVCLLSRSFSPGLCGRTEEGSIIWWTSQMIEGNGGLPQGRTSGENIF